VLRQLHWLPVQCRVEFKVACLVHQLLSVQELGYLADDCRFVSESGRCVLQLANAMTCMLPLTQKFCTFVTVVGIAHVRIPSTQPCSCLCHAMYHFLVVLPTSVNLPNLQSCTCLPFCRSRMQVTLNLNSYILYPTRWRQRH